MHRQPFNDFAGWEKRDSGQIAALVKPDDHIVKGKGSGAYVSYKDLKEGEEIIVKDALSYVSADLEIELGQQPDKSRGNAN